MPMPPRISALLGDPFGPYPDHRILNPDWPRRGGPVTRPVLSSVHMKCGGKDIGLDETELLREALSTSRIVTHPVMVFGVLELETLDWLSATGREWLERDLQMRDNEKRIESKPSRLTLEGIYGDGVNSGSRIEVWLQLHKVMNAAYMTLDDEPTALILHAEDRNRSFFIKNLDVKTYDLSRNFIERYRIRRLIHELIDGSDTPIENRDIEWLITQYLAQVAPLDRNFRIIYDPDDTQARNKKGDLSLKKPRHSRPLHRAGIRRLFAAHAEWILADQIASSSPKRRYLDIQQWVEFVKQVKIARRAARVQATRWGEPWGQQYGDKDVGDIDLSQFGGTRENWNQRLRNALLNKPSLPRKDQNFKPAPTPSVVVSLPLRQTPRLIRPPAREEPLKRDVIQVEYHYDSDFSEASTSSAPDSEPETDPQHDRHLEACIPWYCRVPPVLEPTQHVWRCPGCHDYSIDLLSPDENELQDIPAAHADLLRSKSWSRIAGEKDVLMAFGHLVNNHYAGHLRALGIHLVEEGNRVSVRKWPESKRKSRRPRKSSAADYR